MNLRLHTAAVAKVRAYIQASNCADAYLRLFRYWPAMFNGDWGLILS